MIMVQSLKTVNVFFLMKKEKKNDEEQSGGGGYSHIWTI